MPALLAALDAFIQEHRRCGDLDGGLDGERVWMACESGAQMTRRLDMSPPTESEEARR